MGYGECLNLSSVYTYSLQNELHLIFVYIGSVKHKNKYGDDVYED